MPNPFFALFFSANTLSTLRLPPSKPSQPISHLSSMTPRILRIALASIFTATAFLPAIARNTPAAPRAQPGGSPILLSPPWTQADAELPAAPALAPSGNPDDRIAINWTALPLSMAIPELEKLTGRTVIRPATLPNVADLSLSFATPPTRAEALQAIETLFTVNQLALVPRGEKLLLLVPINTVRSEAPTIIEGSTLDLAPSGRIASKFFQLEFLRASEFVPMISTMLNAQIQTISIFERANAFLVTDTISTLQRVETIIKQVDRPAATPVQAKFYSLEYAKASDIVNKIKALFTGPLQQQLGASTTFNSDDRTNQVVVIGDPRQLPFFDDLIKKLDTKADPNTRNEVIRLKSAQCGDVATLLSNIISGQTRAAQAAQSSGGTSATQRQRTTQTTSANRNTQQRATTQNRNTSQQRTQSASVRPAFATPASGITGGSLGLEGNEFSSFITVQPDTRINAIVVSGTVDDIRIIKELVEKLDVLLAQVRIEVVIAEVTLTDEAQSGIDALGFNVENGKLTGIAGSGPGFTFGGNKDGSSYGSSLQPLTAIIGLGSTPRKNNSNIVSVPAITTMHNKEGKIFIGETRPVITSSMVSDVSSNRTSSVTQMEIGTTITVTPLIGYDGSVQLDVQQEISDVSGTVTVDENTQYIIGKRNTSSSIIVKSGEIIVLGGIQKNASTKARNRLGPIPIIGDLFGKRSRSQTRTELIFFLRPTVLTNTAADNAPAMEQLERMSNKAEVQKVLGQTPSPPKDDVNALPDLPAEPKRHKKKKRG
ncbi:general secretion pathway protein D [Ereboglobus sp. PH5-10]|uniref:secretin N-terminal domain-containing protein n=1 Tax=Ereboglobus sp. PH5-10 TaxID=2940629 RepID=UPI002405F8D4|nr:secretin N-terminal domain-containing protein [Ereboglobus sp. PH5-10]MDF9826246.1 general secretion pathway protein D [Ereboglobus sp. PH5-10]